MSRLLVLLTLAGCAKAGPPGSGIPSPDPALEVAQVLAAASSLSALGQLHALIAGEVATCWAYAGAAKVTGAVADVLLYRGALYPAIEVDPEECGGPALELAVSPLLTVVIETAIREASIIVEAYGQS